MKTADLYEIAPFLLKKYLAQSIASPNRPKKKIYQMLILCSESFDNN
jgi:hypothetical protein